MPHPTPFGLLTAPPPHPACRLIVTIPAKDEAEYITETLDALRVQTNDRGQALLPSAYEVIVLANNCADATAAVCRAYGRRYPSFRLHVFERTLPPDLACVGTARRWMMDTAHARLMQLGRPRGVICSTDADTLVAPDWVYQNLRAVREGARAVGGRILVPAGRGRARSYRKNHLQDVTYRSLQYCLESIIDPCDADPWPRHFQHFGPSTAVTAAAYEACGGIPPLKCLEDVNLVLALERVDIPVTHDRRVWVRTSSRVSHRVAGTAFSHQLDEWAAMEQAREAQRVISFENCKQLFKWKVALRRAYHRRDVADCPHLRTLATRLGWSAGQLAERVRTAPTFGALYQAARRQLELDPSFNDTPIDVAIRNLRDFTRSLRHRASGKHPGGSVPLAPSADARSYA